MNRIDIPPYLGRNIQSPKVVEPITCDRLTAVLPKDRWCGPAAISALTGRSREAAAIWINDFRKVPHYRTIKGSGLSEVIYTLGVFGWSCLPIGVAERVRVASLAEASEHKPDVAFLVGTPRHWLVVQDGKVVDNQERVKPHAESKWRRSTIQSVHYVYATKGLDPVRKRLYDPLPYMVMVKPGKHVFGDTL